MDDLIKAQNRPWYDIYIYVYVTVCMDIQYMLISSSQYQCGYQHHVSSYNVTQVTLRS